MCCCYPTNLIWNLVTAPCWIPKALYQCCTTPSESESQYKAILEDTRKLRPAVGTV
jgi:hypothetical protein